MQNIEILPLSDRSILVRFGIIISKEINSRVLQFHIFLSEQPFEGFIESVPAYAELAIFYDAVKIKAKGHSPFSLVKGHVLRLLQQYNFTGILSFPLVKILACYHPDFGPDLSLLATQHQLTIEEVIGLHTAVIYQVYMIGFMPGFAYMGVLDEKLVTPRKDHPRINVPAGSIGIAGAQTGIYPVDSPGGWQIIGRTPLRLFDKNNVQPCLLKPGDNIQFVAIEKDEFEKMYGN